MMYTTGGRDPRFREEGGCVREGWRVTEIRREMCTHNFTYSVHTSTDKCLHFTYIVHIHITSLFSYLDISLATCIYNTYKCAS